VRIEFRWAEGQYDRLPAMAAELVDQKVTLIIAGGGDRPTLAAKAVTTTIPIVFTGSDDPVLFALVTSLSRPGGNVTGVGVFQSELEVKRFMLLRELAPAIPRIAMLLNPNSPTADRDVGAVEAAARAVGQQIDFLRAGNERDCKFRSSKPAPRARSRRPSPLSCATARRPCTSLATCSSRAGASNLRRSQRAIAFPRPIRLARLPKPVG